MQKSRGDGILAENKHAIIQKPRRGEISGNIRNAYIFYNFIYERKTFTFFFSIVTEICSCKVVESEIPIKSALTGKLL